MTLVNDYHAVLSQRLVSNELTHQYAVSHEFDRIVSETLSGIIQLFEYDGLLIVSDVLLHTVFLGHNRVCLLLGQPSFPFVEQCSCIAVHQFCLDSGGHCDCSNPPRLSDPDRSFLGKAVFLKELRNLRRFAAACLTSDCYHVVCQQFVYYFLREHRYR